VNTSERSADESRVALLNLTRTLKQYLVGRDEVIDLLLLALVSGEPLLMLGPPGAAKSDLVGKFSDALGLADGDYFEYMITAFTEPSEILGPVDIKALREEGSYRRQLRGKLAEAKVVFLDEIFNGNSAILNTLLTVMNERKIYDGGRPMRLEHLMGFFAASNQIPDREELAALKDRFVLKVDLRWVQDSHFDRLIDAGIHNDLLKATGQRPWARGDVGLRDVQSVRQRIHAVLGERYEQEGSAPRFPEAVHRTFRRLVAELSNKGVPLSDREVIKLYRMIIVRGYLFNGRLPESIELEDLVVLRYVAETEKQFALVRSCVNAALGIDGDAT
jgi:MoxR-like ATPase